MAEKASPSGTSSCSHARLYTLNISFTTTFPYLRISGAILSTTGAFLNLKSFITTYILPLFTPLWMKPLYIHLYSYTILLCSSSPTHSSQTSSFSHIFFISSSPFISTPSLLLIMQVTLIPPSLSLMTTC